MHEAPGIYKSFLLNKESWVLFCYCTFRQVRARLHGLCSVSRLVMIGGWQWILLDYNMERYYSRSCWIQTCNTIIVTNEMRNKSHKIFVLMQQKILFPYCRQCVNTGRVKLLSVVLRHLVLERAFSVMKYSNPSDNIQIINIRHRSRGQSGLAQPISRPYFSACTGLCVYT